MLLTKGGANGKTIFITNPVYSFIHLYVFLNRGYNENKKESEKAILLQKKGE